MSWQEAWEEKRTPWDAGASAPSLCELVDCDDLPEGRALVPGAGSGYDVLTLAGPKRKAIGLDLAPGAKQRFEALREQEGVPAEQAEMVVGNFFDWQPDELFDVIWDYTFLCAIEPEMRQRWAERVDELLKPDGELVTLIFPIVDKDPNEGPPYALSPELVRELVTPRFEPIYLEPVEHSHPGREGKEWLGRWRRA
ncbi:methyltransferase domain-containing protein [Persicimonas caeni]|nr:methyltransferase domain-containing protein [Persicimonas caeni]